MSNLDAPVDNTPYSDEELEHFKELLQEQKQETEEEIEAIHEAVEDIEDQESNEKSASTHHQGDIGSEEEEREKYLIMLKKERDKLDEITAALDRIELGTYGVCEDTGKKIQKERLEAIPYARFSMEARKKDEEKRQEKPGTL